jgi:hypothetical protein
MLDLLWNYLTEISVIQVGKMGRNTSFADGLFRHSRMICKVISKGLGKFRY